MVHNLVHHVVRRPILRILPRSIARESEQKVCIIVCLQIISRLSRTDSLREALSKEGRGTLFDRCEEFFEEGFVKITQIHTHYTVYVQCTFLYTLALNLYECRDNNL